MSVDLSIPCARLVRAMQDKSILQIDAEHLSEDEVNLDSTRSAISYKNNLPIFAQNHYCTNMNCNT